MLPFLALLIGTLPFSQWSLAATPQIPPPPGDPYADPEHDIYNPLRYIASNTLTSIAVAFVLVLGFIQSYCIFKYGAKFMLSMTLACYTFAAGLSLRFGLHNHPHSRGLYIAQYLLVVLSPCGFIAAEYVLLGRLTRFLKGDKYLLISPHKITAIFVGSDISTFLIQAIGGSVSLSGNPGDKVNTIGARVFLAGLALQLLSFLVFTSIYLIFLWKIHKHEPQAWVQDETSNKTWYRDWRALAAVMTVSCVGVLVRSVYRVIELSEGYQSDLVHNEPLFYGLDTFPLLIALAVYLPPFWPGMFITNESLGSKGTRSLKEKE